MKRITLVGSILTLSILFLYGCSCHTTTFDYVGINSITASVIDSTGLSLTEISEVNSEFSISIEYALEAVESKNGVYDCDSDFVQDLDASTALMTLNKPFMLNGNTISANTNILELDGIIGNIGDFDSLILFSDEFLTNAEFLNEDYTYNFHVETNEAFVMMDSIVLTMNL